MRKIADPSARPPEEEPTKAKCLFPPCDRPAKGRGLCATHYAGAFYHVSKGYSTWEQLENEGRALPSRTADVGGRFSTWLKGRSGKEST